MATTNEILEALTAFVTKIDETIVDGKREGVLRSTEEIYTRYPIDERSIEQTDYGVKRRNYATEEFVKESWFHATRAVVWRLQESRAYADLIRMFEGTPIEPERATRLVDAFLHRIAYKFLEAAEEAPRAELLAHPRKTWHSA